MVSALFSLALQSASRFRPQGLPSRDGGAMGSPVRYRRIRSKAWLAARAWMRSRRRRPESIFRQKVPSGVARPM